MNKFHRIIKDEVFNFLNKTLIQENKDNHIKFKTSSHEDHTSIDAYLNDNKIGSLYMEELFGYNYEFDDVFSEEEFGKIFPKDRIIKISHVTINKEYRNLGVGSKLMEKALKLMRSKGFDQFYLNASPMGDRGLSLGDLVSFYKKFGFKEWLNQGGNVLMYLK